MKAVIIKQHVEGVVTSSSRLLSNSENLEAILAKTTRGLPSTHPVREGTTSSMTRMFTVNGLVGARLGRGPNRVRVHRSHLEIIGLQKTIVIMLLLCLMHTFF